jgi:hypothetical protein
MRRDRGSREGERGEYYVNNEGERERGSREGKGEGVGSGSGTEREPWTQTKGQCLSSVSIRMKEGTATIRSDRIKVEGE